MLAVALTQSHPPNSSCCVLRTKCVPGVRWVCAGFHGPHHTEPLTAHRTHFADEEMELGEG